ncbi:type II secretion system GspH family protein [Patescibacteria group bacterium]|nr:type II secretion system GspH family protein [Patescibacteria group bacterium]MBU1034901.1 type II secretion system GspH family protein [Patescibacteria group bacterium]MBU1629893.1 type II secretion system GspH family protein [Patescibacteria group bacterium]MBU1907734.1 type II secretion system GspH family protein [Patescibacteria group bacterium]
MKISLKSGFSILELLIVLMIAGLLAAGAIYTLSVSRATSRDAKRVSDISVMRSALSQYWLQKASYPVSQGVELGKAEQNAIGLTTDGLVGPDGGGAVILSPLPIGPKANEYYFYKATVGGYSLRFSTERETAYGSAGTYYAHAGGVDQEDVER